MEKPEISTRRALGGAAAVLLATVIGRGAAMAVAVAALGIDVGSSDPMVRRDGILAGVGILGGTAAGLAVMAWVTRPAPRSALAIVRPSPAAWIGWTIAGLALGLAFDGAAWAVGRPAVEPEWIDAYRSAPLALLAIALIATSIFEELFFRGLMQTALARTRVGRIGAIAIPALLFTAAHVPDDAWRFADVLAGAVLLGVARDRSGSSLTMMPAHVIGNLKVLALIAATT